MSQSQVNTDTSSQKKSVIPKKNRQKSSGRLPQFNSSLPMTLLHAREAVMSKFLPTLKEHGLSAQQWRAIRTLEQENGLTVSELSKRCYLHKPSMSRIVQNLEKRGFIKCTVMSADRRSTTLHLTQSGLGIVKLITPQSEERYQFIIQQFGAGKLELLQELLEDLVDAINEDSYLE